MLVPCPGIIGGTSSLVYSRRIQCEVPVYHAGQQEVDITGRRLSERERELGILYRFAVLNCRFQCSSDDDDNESENEEDDDDYGAVQKSLNMPL